MIFLEECYLLFDNLKKMFCYLLFLSHFFILVHKNYNFFNWDFFGPSVWKVSAYLIFLSGIFFFWRFFILMCTIFKVSIEFVTMLLLIKVLFLWPWSIRDLSALVRNQTCVPCTGGWIFNHWNSREVPRIICLWVKWSLSFYCAE